MRQQQARASVVVWLKNFWARRATLWSPEIPAGALVVTRTMEEEEKEGDDWEVVRRQCAGSFVILRFPICVLYSATLRPVLRANDNTTITSPAA